MRIGVGCQHPTSAAPTARSRARSAPKRSAPVAMPAIDIALSKPIFHQYAPDSSDLIWLGLVRLGLQVEDFLDVRAREDRVATPHPLFKPEPNQKPAQGGVQAEGMVDVVVHRERLGRVGAVHRAGAGEHEVLNTVVAAAFKYVHEADEVGVHVGVRVDQRVALGRPARRASISLGSP